MAQAKRPPPGGPASPDGRVDGRFVFAAQMLNFPVAAETSGHFLGGALATIMLGPWMGALVVTVVVVVPALLFADGGIVALGSGDPDGLERVAIDQGFSSTATDGDAPLADYEPRGIDSRRVGTLVVGAIGVTVVFLLGLGVVSVLRRRTYGFDPANIPRR